MSFCWDVYVWVPRRAPETFHTFIDLYVDSDDPRDERLSAFVRTYVTGAPTDLDAQALADLRADPDRDTFTLYLRGRAHPWAMITIADGGAAVLGLSLDDPDGSPQGRGEAERLLARLREQFASPAGIAGVEMPPPHSQREWEEERALLRVGTPAGPHA